MTGECGMWNAVCGMWNREGLEWNGGRKVGIGEGMGFAMRCLGRGTNGGNNSALIEVWHGLPVASLVSDGACMHALEMYRWFAPMSPSPWRMNIVAT